MRIGLGKDVSCSITAGKQGGGASKCEHNHNLSGSVGKNNGKGDGNNGGGKGEGEADDAEAERAAEGERRKARRDRYMSLASKMRVDQMLEQIHIDAKFDFDYIAFLCVPRACAPSGRHACEHACVNACVQACVHARVLTHVFAMRCVLQV